MTSDLRRKALESTISHEDKTSFEISCRCTRLLALWAAELMEMDAAQAGIYAANLVIKKVESAGFDLILGHILEDMRSHDKPMDENILVLQLNRCLAKAHEEISLGI